MITEWLYCGCHQHGEGNKARRGGSWYSATGSIRCSNRGNRSADRQNKEIGFRLIRLEK
ncbi:MAG: SUMF1/EgtB/PvdO family nonheme iron enzyme [Proteobacteria bacterium]|nr:SUMF1/EgtB/PvdO family nonheme iron enzyme [Pseudomonadota bacterium]MBU1739176.1 SUMF1/EgtB/PvdO family nonheme iron enzyme [Pseudomonadota bacterium]